MVVDPALNGYAHPEARLEEHAFDDNITSDG